MKVLAGGCRVYSENDGRISTHGSWTARTVISQESGAKHISQTVSTYTPGLSPGDRESECGGSAVRRRR